MVHTPYPLVRRCQIPADCYNSAFLAQSRRGASLRFGLPGLSDNVMLLSPNLWRCWNRKLDQILVSWSDFEPGKRCALRDPVECSLTLHHSYSRTIIYQIYYSLAQVSERELRQLSSRIDGRILALADKRATQ
jgi:hypothetical protein